MAENVSIKELPEHVGDTVTVNGWIMKTRSSGKISFSVLRDGSGYVQAVTSKADVSDEVWSTVKELTHETSLALTGEVRKDERSPGGVELATTSVLLLGKSVDFPITPKEHGTTFLFEHRHLWLRSRRQVAILSVRNEVIQAIRDFLYRREFRVVDTPILTGSIGESAGTLFETDYFDLGKAYLAQTGQLYLEAAAAALGKVYSFGPTFRAEKSKTRRHLTEFWMVEPEMAWFDSEDSMCLQEEFISYIIERCLERCQSEFEELERDTGKLASVQTPFPRMSYTDAVAELKAKDIDIEWGQDLGAEHETVLSQIHDRPLMVYNYPRDIRAFYMKRNPDDTRTVLNNDCLAPEGYGEVIGGSQREDDHDLLLGRIREEGLPEKDYDWYLDLRKYGTFVHSGFGMGLERAVAWVCGIPHIREAIAFPRQMHRLYP
ncbi:MAG: asparagine--tRNA ligase [Gemmatimonadetes bacterium]|nr:asparagine--tRNA ligase [Gemmatimonadota bacterium]